MHFENWPIFDELIYFRNNLIRTLNHVDYTMLRLEIFHHVISFNNFGNYHRIYIKHNVINKSNCKKTQNSFLLIVIFSSNSSYLLWMREMIFPICLFRLFSYSSINCHLKNRFGSFMIYSFYNQFSIRTKNFDQYLM